MFIAASSLSRYLVTYGMGTRWQVVLVLQTWHTTTPHSVSPFPLFGTRELSVAASCWVIGLAVAESMLPHLSQMTARWRSEEFSSRSCRRNEAPCAMIESRSISPKRIPPWRLRPLSGWRVSWLMGPLARTCDLSLTYA